MKNKKWGNRILRFFKLVYIKIFRIHDTPQRISLGLGLGVFLGILPGTGPIAAIFLALLLRVNRAASLLGSLLTNTWLSLVTFLLSIRVGSSIMGIDWHETQDNWIYFIRNFKSVDLLRLSALKIIWPVIIGYFIVSFCLGLRVYLITLPIINKLKHENKSGIHISC